jgi:NAD(P) transhydrogenase
MAHYDMLVIGSGPAVRSRYPSRQGWQESGHRGTQESCRRHLHQHGTIPSKSLREAVLFLSGFRQRNLYGPATGSKRTLPSKISPCAAITS